MIDLWHRESEKSHLPELNPEPRVQNLSFDLYERYTIAAHAVRTLVDRPEPSVLDVGGYSEQLWPGFESLALTFMPECRPVVVDIHREPGLTNYVCASGMKLPFRDESFDFVLAQDSLEHIPEDAREKFLSELLRVSSAFVLLSFPFRSSLNQACDRLVYRYIQTRKKIELPALKEHLDLSLPRLDDVRRQINGAGFPFRLWTHGNSLVWLTMMIAKNHLWTQGVPELGQELDSIFNVHFAAGDYREPCYRAFFLISKGEDRGKTLADFGDFRREQLSAADQQEVCSLCHSMMASVSSVEAEQRSQHAINLIEALGHNVSAVVDFNRQRALDFATRLAEATSLADHLQNLLVEEQHRRAGAEVRYGTGLAEAKSRAEHLQNLLVEEQHRRADAEVRYRTGLAEATSRAEHLQNLLVEEQRRRADVEVRFRETDDTLRSMAHAEEELRLLRNKVSRFPARLFIR